MRKYVIWVESEGVKKYVAVNFLDGTSFAVDSKDSATALPNRAVASSVCKALRPAINKQRLNASIGVEVL